MRFIIGATLAALFLAMTSYADAQTVEFDFRSAGGNGLAGLGSGNFDPGAAADVITVGGLSATIVDITALEYDVTGDLPVETGNTLSSANGDGVVTNISGQDALGIQNPSVDNTQFDLIGGGTESSDLNPGETLTFTFDQDVQFTAIELESVVATDIFNVLIGGTAMLETTGDDAFIDDLGGLTGLTIPAGTEITFEVDGVLETATGGAETSIRIETFTVLDAAGVEVLFDFRSTGGNGVAGIDPNTTFDPGNVGDIITLDGLATTIVDITAPEYDVTGPLPVETGVTLSAANGDAVITNVSGQDSLGIDNPSIDNPTFDLIGDGNDNGDFNPGETLTISFDQAVQFTAIELESVLPAGTFDVLINGTPMLETMGDDEFIDDLGGLAGFTIPANAEITFAVDGVLETATGGATTSLRIETFTVEIVDSEIIVGDINLDTFVNFADISPFIAVLTSQEFQAEADTNGDGLVTFADISPFIQLLTGQ